MVLHLMSNSISPIELTKLKPLGLASRASKVDRKDFARAWTPSGLFSQFLEKMPNILAAKDFKEIVSALAEARQNSKQIMMAMGAHVIKVGLSPIINDLIAQGVITAVALNGAGIIHDLELAMIGRTSEDVSEGLSDGTFGMAGETADFLNRAIGMAEAQNLGLGQAVGKAILEEGLPFKDESILACAARASVPATVHVAIGTDIIHVHPGFDPRAAGQATHLDFRRYAAVVADLEGGVYLNVGSAVILPEVFLKALTLVRNMGHQVNHFTTVNMDFMRHYRPMTNVVSRPTSNGGKGYSLVGHHEIMLPLMAAAIIEELHRTDVPA